MARQGKKFGSSLPAPRTRKNTFYSQRTHSIVREHILYETSHSVVNIGLSLPAPRTRKNTFYSERTQAIVREHRL